MSYNSGFELDPRDAQSLGFWHKLHPGVRSATLMWMLLLAVALINSFTGGVSILFLYPLQILLYGANGYLAGHLAKESGYPSSDLTRVGAIAGVVAWVLPALYYIVFGLILGIVTLGIGFIGLFAACLFGPVDLAIHAGCGAFGGWIYGRQHEDPYDLYR